MKDLVIDIPMAYEAVTARDLYRWPGPTWSKSAKWALGPAEGRHMFTMPENRSDLEVDSRWPAFFPSSMCVATSGDAETGTMERIVGASIVNRFPYVVAVPVCRINLSKRHYARRNFMRTVESAGDVAIQFLEPGPCLDRVLASCAEVEDVYTSQRIKQSGLSTRLAVLGNGLVLSDAYLIYEGRLVEPSQDFEGEAIYSAPWIDVGSHRVYFFEIQVIQLRQSIAEGRERIRWRSLPQWNVASASPGKVRSSAASRDDFIKRYNPDYAFPSEKTVSFRTDEVIEDMAVQHVQSVDNWSKQENGKCSNDATRWPCFFPSSVGMITTWAEEGVPNVMPCGSTTVVSRHPFIIAPCVSDAEVNERYAKRGTLSTIRKTGRFGCGVPYWSESIVRAIEYAGNVSILKDRDKVEHAGLHVESLVGSPLLSDLPIHFDCRVIEEVRLGTHVMFLGEVERIFRRGDLNKDNPLTWSPHPWVENSCHSLHRTEASALCREEALFARQVRSSNHR
ncbi:MAG: flavin reductase family protein [Planctomycetota bacterium]